MVLLQIGFSVYLLFDGVQRNPDVGSADFPKMRVGVLPQEFLDRESHRFLALYRGTLIYLLQVACRQRSRVPGARSHSGNGTGFSSSWTSLAQILRHVRHWLIVERNLLGSTV